MSKLVTYLTGDVTVSECEPLIAQGNACNVGLITLPLCEAGAYCGYTDGVGSEVCVQMYSIENDQLASDPVLCKGRNSDEIDGIAETLSVCRSYQGPLQFGSTETLSSPFNCTATNSYCKIKFTDDVELDNGPSCRCNELTSDDGSDGRC